MKYTEITYDELGCYIGKKAVVLVSKDWLESVKSTIDVKKECSKCNTNLPLSDFNSDKRRLFGKRSQCRSCYKTNASKSNSSEKEPTPKIEFTITKL
jgi:hypothetical protein